MSQTRRGVRRAAMLVLTDLSLPLASGIYGSLPWSLSGPQRRVVSKPKEKQRCPSLENLFSDTKKEVP
jgi:hypothetical protein